MGLEDKSFVDNISSDSDTSSWPDSGLPWSVQSYVVDSLEMGSEDFESENVEMELSHELDSFIHEMLKGEGDPNFPAYVDEMFDFFASEEIGPGNQAVSMPELEEMKDEESSISSSLSSLDLDVLIITVGSDEYLPMPPSY